MHVDLVIASVCGDEYIIAIHHKPIIQLQNHFDKVQQLRSASYLSANPTGEGQLIGRTKQAVQLLIPTSVSDQSWISKCLCMPLSGDVLSFKARKAVDDGLSNVLNLYETKQAEKGREARHSPDGQKRAMVA
eukprot:scaffold60247_cov48-Attheya_sp.AAC.2